MFGKAVGGNLLFKAAVADGPGAEFILGTHASVEERNVCFFIVCFAGWLNPDRALKDLERAGQAITDSTGCAELVVQ
jgi:hypothetical protein